jgi:hypothetical protein
MTTQENRLAEIRKAIEAENVSYGELSELQDLSATHPQLFADDPLLAEAAGIPEEQWREQTARKLSALPDFERGYFTAAFWTTDDDAGSGEYANTGRADDHFARLHPANLAEQLRQCEQFQQEHAGTLAECESYQAGIDFWLTRNGHGSGFWDGDYDHLDGTGEAAQRLTDAAHGFGEANCFLDTEGVFIE